MLQALDGAAARRWAELSVRALERDRVAIDRINVYPVADNDTGTNLLHTMRAAVAALDRNAVHPVAVANGAGPPASPRVDEVFPMLARGALEGARGNSGMLLSQVIRGLAERCVATETMDGPALCEALERAAELAQQALAVPQEGTLLTVLRAAARAAGTSEPALGEVVRAATTAAFSALAATTSQLPALAAAGVVDAGGRGLVVLLDALHAAVHDGSRLAPELPADGARSLPQPRPQAAPTGYGYEVMYLLREVDETAATRLRRTLTGLGDCVSVLGDGLPESGVPAAGRDTGPIWAVHVHCDDIGRAIESGIEAGRVSDIRVTRFADQLAAEGSRAPACAAPRPVSAREHAVLACARGEQLAELFRAEGAFVLLVDEARAPGTDDLVAAIRGTGAGHVLVLPNDETMTDLAEAAARSTTREGIEVVVVPTTSPVQGLAALAVHDPGRRIADDTVALAEAAAATRRGGLVVAEGPALTWVGYCRGGDVLGLIDGEVVLIEVELIAAACDLADRMLIAGGELVTVLVSEQAPDELPELLTRHLRRTHPEVEVACYPCGDLAEALLLGVEC